MSKHTNNKYTDDERERFRHHCWSLWCRGNTNVTAIARVIGIDKRTVKNYLDYMGQATRDYMDAGKASVDLYAQLEEVKKAGWVLYREAKGNAKVGGLAKVTEAIKMQAGMLDISTTKGIVDVEHSGGVVIESEQMGEIARVLSECGALKIDEEE